MVVHIRGQAWSIYAPRSCYTWLEPEADQLTDDAHCTLRRFCQVRFDTATELFFTRASVVDAGSRVRCTVSGI